MLGSSKVTLLNGNHLKRVWILLLLLSIGSKIKKRFIFTFSLGDLIQIHGLIKYLSSSYNLCDKSFPPYIQLYDCRINIEQPHPHVQSLTFFLLGEKNNQINKQKNNNQKKPKTETKQTKEWTGKKEKKKRYGLSNHVKGWLWGRKEGNVGLVGRARCEQGIITWTLE